MSQMPTNQFIDKAQNSLINYKIVKCKNWEKDKTCKYGSKCTFAHGDAELRNKIDNINCMSQPFPVVMPFMVDQNGQPIMMQPAAGFDYNQMQMMPSNIDQNQLMMGMNMIPSNANIPSASNGDTNDLTNGGNNKSQQ